MHDKEWLQEIEQKVRLNQQHNVHFIELSDHDVLQLIKKINELVADVESWKQSAFKRDDALKEAETAYEQLRAAYAILGDEAAKRVLKVATKLKQIAEIAEKRAKVVGEKEGTLLDIIAITRGSNE